MNGCCAEQQVMISPALFAVVLRPGFPLSHMYFHTFGPTGSNDARVPKRTPSPSQTKPAWTGGMSRPSLAASPNSGSAESQSCPNHAWLSSEGGAKRLRRSWCQRSAGCRRPRHRHPREANDVIGTRSRSKGGEDGTSKDLLARRFRVNGTLVWLRQNNLDYPDVEIGHSTLQTFTGERSAYGPPRTNCTVAFLCTRGRTKR